jgi:hypothetical protein
VPTFGNAHEQVEPLQAACNCCAGHAEHFAAPTFFRSYCISRGADRNDRLNSICSLRLAADAMLDAIQDILIRQWSELFARPSGPMSFRFLLQPTMAAIYGIFDGLCDARNHRTPYLWTVVNDPKKRRARIRQRFAHTAKILALGLVMDVIYQFIAFQMFYPGEALVVVFVLAVVPYVIVRGATDRIGRRWLDHDPHAPAPRK